MKNIFLLGATGSIGSQVLDVIRGNEDFTLQSISVGRNITLCEKVINEFQPRFVSVMNERDMTYLQNKYPKIEFGFGEAGLIKAATYGTQSGLLVNAVVGFYGLKPTIEAIKKRRDILLANKETLVVAGDIIKQLVKKYEVNLIPIDSEHSAIHQCIKSGNRKDISKIIITASGGSFRHLTREELHNVSIKEALNHPNWSMGAKITIDSATMVNKGLEVIEAHHLFDINYDQIETLLHPESIIHSMVEFQDSSIIAQMSIPDMRVPIQYALYYPEKKYNQKFRKIDFNDLHSISFRPMDYNRFPALALAYQVGKMGGIMPTIYNAANEVAVNLFLENKIKFLDIENIIFQTVESANNIINPTLEEIIKTDQDIRYHLFEKYEVN